MKQEATDYDDAPAAPQPAASSAEFTGERTPLFYLVVKNSILTLLTAGIYRFWAKTNVRQFFWSRTRVLGTPLEYTGTPGELFLGFLIVVAVLVPFFGLYEGIGVFLGEVTPGQQAGIDLAYAVAIGLLVQAAFYRMWRYRLMRTTWRGIRLGLDGSTRTYVGLSILYWAANILCLGLLTPWVRTALWRYRIGHSRFGQSYFSFDGSAKPLIVPWLIVLLTPVLLISYLAWGYLDAAILMYEHAASGQADSSQPPDISISGPGPFIVILLLITLPPLLFIWYRVREFRHFINHTVLGETRFTSNIRTDVCVAIVFFAWCMLAVLFFMFALFIGAIGAGLAAVANSVVLSFVGAVAVVLFVMTISPLIAIVFTRFALVESFCKTLGIEGTEHLDTIVQSSEAVPARGEGLADAFDVGAI